MSAVPVVPHAGRLAVRSPISTADSPHHVSDFGCSISVIMQVPYDLAGRRSVQQDIQQRERATARLHDRRHRWLPAGLVPTWHAPVVRDEEANGPARVARPQHDPHLAQRDPHSRRLPG
jgi:hypothetical protein